MRTTCLLSRMKQRMTVNAPAGAPYPRPEHHPQWTRPTTELAAHPVVHWDWAADHSAEAVKAATDVSSRVGTSIHPRSVSR